MRNLFMVVYGLALLFVGAACQSLPVEPRFGWLWNLSCTLTMLAGLLWVALPAICKVIDDYGQSCATKSNG